MRRQAYDRGRWASKPYFGCDGQPGSRRAPVDFVAGMVQAYCPVPTDPNERCFHDDLPEMDMTALALERGRVQVALRLADRPHWWHVERLARVEAEIVARKERRDA